ncbi:phage head closure protein [Lysobacter sp. H21R4]|uniref:phage head closure protein n=1 Tax=Lysobacter sp. H21R4 TaxID=2781021 RepID=UPI00188808DD|nr:phage head closure protein [Lysobacter sp. H21R4]QOY61865.1 phage head closure protein [Lysobacter sp. H21R4]
MAFTAQQLNHKITFERLETVIDPVTGYRTEDWVEVASAFARVDPMLGRERLASQQITAQEVTKFTTRYLSSVTPADRLIYNGEEWNMQSIVNVGGRNRETLIYATKN